MVEGVAAAAASASASIKSALSGAAGEAASKLSGSLPSANGLKHADYHNPPITAQSGATIHTLKCLTSQIHLGFHLFPHIIHTLLTTYTKSANFILITDTNISQLFLEPFLAEWDSAVKALGSGRVAPRLLTRAIPPGESSKTRDTKAALEDWLLKERVTRDAVVIALGGGVVGDLVGFVASTYMRGVKFVQIPTTLLAMVDSSVGGKTAVDTEAGKNLIGAFYQPDFIFIDAGLLETLPEREFSNGMAEVVKTAAIWDADDFDKLEANASEIRSAVLDPPTSTDPKAVIGRTLDTRTVAQSLLLDVIRGSVGVKAHIVNIDEKETGLRNLVNFGHSIGHAIEAVLTPDMLHGECVSIGMILEAELSRTMHGLSQVTLTRLTRCLQLYSLPTSIDDPRVTAITTRRNVNLSAETLLDIMRVDKKNEGADKRVVLLSRIGSTVEQKASSVPDDIIRHVICDSVRVTALLSTAPAPKHFSLATPGSKSISNRALLLAALSSGTTRLRGLLHSDDTAVMIAALKDLGAAKISWEDNGNTIVVQGSGGQLQPPVGGKEIYLQNAGTAARFMTTVAALVNARSGSKDGKITPTVVTGNKRMQQRPIGPLVDALRSNGVDIQYKNAEGCLPLTITGNPSADGTRTGLPGGDIELSASISSQYVSSILLCAPYAAKEVTLHLVGDQVISQPYIDMTTTMMAEFGVKVQRLPSKDGQGLSNSYRIPQTPYTPPTGGVYDVEGDASSATYPLALAAILGTSCTVTNVGSRSLQGDAGFAKRILEPMGCKVSQDERSTTVNGPPRGQLRQLGVVDMEELTDAFLTAAVLFAAAPLPSADGKKSTRITGIANQRVKECNRIKAMADELAKLDVQTAEWDDGIEVTGSQLATAIEALKTNAEATVIHCYDDHRVAMAFSVLASIASSPGITLDEKRCVEKTWPAWWDELSRTCGVPTVGIDLPHNGSTSGASASTSTSPTSRRYDPDATIFCIGMRASGKTYLGGFGAAALGRPFLDADVIFNERIGLNNFVRDHGWPAFRKAELEILRELIETKPKGYLVSLGGGVVETPECRELLENYSKFGGPVVHVKRDIGEVVKFLETSDRPSYGEPVMDVFRRRDPYFRQCASAELVSYTGSRDEVSDAFDADAPPAPTIVQNSDGIATAVPDPLPTSASIRKTFGLEAEVSRFFHFISGTNTNKVPGIWTGQDGGSPNARLTYFLSLTFPDIRPCLSHVEELSTGADAIEFRVDLLNPSGSPPTQPQIPPLEYVEDQLAALRQHTGLPIVYTVRTKSQGGMFPDNKSDEYFALLRLGLRHACEYIDLEVGFPAEKLEALNAQKGHSTIIASWHDWSGAWRWSGPDAVKYYKLASQYGDIVKLVGKANTPADNTELEAFRLRMDGEAVARGEVPKPLLAINMGALGQLSRVLNPVLSPITHNALPVRAAPGQMTFEEIQKTLHLIGRLPPKKFFLFGTPIAHSLSPTIHSTAFAKLGLPHTYGLHEDTEVNEATVKIIRSEDFGGASVTIPHKLKIMNVLDSVTAHAKLIGAVNTIIPRRNAAGKIELEGDNTDWIAIDACARRSLSPVQLSSATFTALVIGAGGSARAALYAAHQVGAKTIWLYNRTTANAETLASQVPAEWNVKVVKDLKTLPIAPALIISNVPADGTGLVEGEGKGVVLPVEILSNPHGGVAIDMSYKPPHTPLLQLVSQANATHATSLGEDRHNLRQGRLWTGVPGLTILLEQACHQFSRWTGRELPRQYVERVAWEKYSR